MELSHTENRTATSIQLQMVVFGCSCLSNTITMIPLIIATQILAAAAPAPVT